jgi:two-component system OmpR family response regulator
MRILLVEDDIKIASFIVKGLKEAGFVVDHASDGEAGLDLASSESYDAAIIDIMLPKLDGLSLIDQLRSNNIKTPVLILSAKQSVEDRVKGLQTGSDDYLTKPFAFQNCLPAFMHLSEGAAICQTQVFWRSQTLRSTSLPMK